MKYQRRPEVVRAQVVKNSGGQAICKSACKIHVPMRFKDKDLAEVGIKTYVYGLFPVILSTGDYMVANINAMIELSPTRTTTTVIDEVEYYEFSFDAGTVMFPSTRVLQNDSIMFEVFNEFIFLGKLPWYVNYSDVGRLFDTALKYAGSRVGHNAEVIELIASMIARPKDNRTVYLREVLTSYKDAENDKISFVPLKSVYHSVNNTLNKLAGSYMRAGIDSALVSPSDSVGKIERILRA